MLENPVQYLGGRAESRDLAQCRRRRVQAGQAAVVGLTGRDVGGERLQLFQRALQSQCLPGIGREGAVAGAAASNGLPTSMATGVRTLSSIPSR